MLLRNDLGDRRCYFDVHVAVLDHIQIEVEVRMDPKLKLTSSFASWQFPNLFPPERMSPFDLEWPQ